VSRNGHVTKTAIAPRSRAGGGPRTEAGKRRTRRNAITHGIFANTVLESHESLQDYRRLHESLREDLEPDGAVEEVLVEQIVMLYWRLRRVLEAEKGEIVRRADLLVDDRWSKWEQELRENDGAFYWSLHGLLDFSQNPWALSRCISLLQRLRGSIDNEGLVPKKVFQILERVYGQHGVDHPEGLVYDILIYLHDMQDGSLSAEACKEAIVKAIEAEIKRLEERHQAVEAAEESRTNCEIQASSVPEATERLVRYETALYRQVDKTLLQLERLQRRRRGEKDLPPIKVDFDI